MWNELSLSRRSRNQKRVRRLNNNHPQLSGQFWMIRRFTSAQNFPANAGANGKNPLGSSHYGRTIVPKNISAATPICAKNIKSHSVRAYALSQTALRKRGPFGAD